MWTLVGFFYFSLLALFSGTLLRRLAGERDPWLLCFASIGLAGVWLILGGALLLPWLSPSASLCVLGIVSALGTAATVRNRAFPALEVHPDSLWLTVAALPGALLTGFFALFIMSVSFGVDDGFFVHSSNMGMILAGKYPPTSFLGEPWQGHYGKDLLTALLALCFDVNFLEMEWISTCAIQVLHFFFLLHWIRVETGKVLPALMGTYFAFFGSAFGSHLGLADTIANNNAVAYWTLTLCSYLLLRWWSTRQISAALLAGLVLGADALIYELHFGLLGLTLFSFCVFSRKRYLGFTVLVTTAVFLACVEGGAITHIAQRLVSGPAEYQKDARKSWQSQNVDLHFPKSEPFVLRRDNLRPSRFFETKLRPTGADFSPSRDSVPLWSPKILASFWYPVWLAPLVLLGLIRGRNLLAGWFFCLGVFSVLTPSLVSFGYFEAETARWLFGAAVGFSVAFALVVAQFCDTAKPKKYFAWLVLALTLWFNIPVIPLETKEMLVALQNPGNALRDGSPGIIPNGSLIPNPRGSLAHHYGFDDADWRTTEKLRQLSVDEPDFLTSKYLVNYPDEEPPQNGLHPEVASGGMLNIVGLQTGLSGRLPAGIAGAPENLHSAPLFSQTLQARSFWAEPELGKLRDLGVRWLLTDNSRLSEKTQEAIAQLDGISKKFETGELTLWETPKKTISPDVLSPVLDLKVKLPGTGADLRARQPFTLTADLDADAAGTAELEFRYLSVPEQEPSNPDDPLRDKVSVTGKPQKDTLRLVGPYYPGTYRMEWRNRGDDGWKKLTELTFL